MFNINPYLLDKVPLSKREMLVIRMRLFYRMPSTSIAKDTGICANTVTKLVHSAMQAMRSYVIRNPHWLAVYYDYVQANEEGRYARK